MSLTITLPPPPEQLRAIIAQPDQSAPLLPLAVRIYDVWDQAFRIMAAQYEEICTLADAGVDEERVNGLVRNIWSIACEWMTDATAILTEARNLVRSRYRREHVAFLSRHTAQLAELMRTIVVVWPELDLDTPDEIYQAVWTIRIPPMAYLRAMWNLFWSAIRHPRSETTIELKTGRVLYRE